MSDNVCPKCGKPLTYADTYNTYTWTSNTEELQSEIARLKAALEQDEKEILIEMRRAEKAIAALEKAEMESVSLCATLITRGTELHLARERRDEARRWAKYYQKLAQQWRKAYENVWKNNHVMPFGSIMYGTQKPRQNDE